MGELDSPFFCCNNQVSYYCYLLTCFSFGVFLSYANLLYSLLFRRLFALLISPLVVFHYSLKINFVKVQLDIICVRQHMRILTAKGDLYHVAVGGYHIKFIRQIHYEIA